MTDDEVENVARAYLQEHYPADCEILSRDKRAEPDGVYFVANRGTDDLLRQYLGDGGFFVVRETGEVWSFGSGQLVHEGLDYWLNWYSEGWRPGFYRLTIREVMKPERFAGLIFQFGVCYLIREIECNTAWERMVQYGAELVLERLRNLPCVFTLTADQARAVISQLKSEPIATFDYAYAGPRKRFDSDPAHNSENELGPQYEYA